VALVLIAGLAAWWRVRAGLPHLDGTQTLAGLGEPVRIERDILGVPTITAANRADAARALGFLHAQDRFFQMDLLRRGGAGELAELLGSAAVSADRARRLHGFRRVAEKALALLPPEKRALLDAYVAGVNAGLTTLPRAPWEYAALRSAPRAWQPVDSFLAAYEMWFQLQDSSGRLEQSVQALRLSLGVPAAEFFAPRGSATDAALDGSSFPEPALPAFRLQANEDEQAGIVSDPSAETALGSNSFALGGAHAPGGLLASDMHLGLAMPAIWYRAVMKWPDRGGAIRQLVGVTLPGIPTLAAGSNGQVAWAYTNAYVDTTDLVVLEVDDTAQIYYRTPQGYREIEERVETINVRGNPPVKFTARWTEWGPVISQANKNRPLVLRWNAHDAVATNFEGLDLENATTTAEAIAIAHRMGMPNQNFLALDRSGTPAWTLTGLIPRRVGYDGRYPVSWSFGDRRWDGWLKPEEIPAIVNPPDGTLWTANQRMVGGDDYAKLGDAGYYDGSRARQIRDSLQALIATGQPTTAADLLAIQLDDRALFLERWQKLMLSVLNDSAVATKKSRAELRDAVRQWNGHASVDSAAYRLVKVWRQKVVDRTLAPISEVVSARYPDFNPRLFRYEDAVWRLVQEQPARLLNPAHTSWESLLLAAADDVMTEVDGAGTTPDRFRWGDANRLRMPHPIARGLPGFLGRFLNAPAIPLPGDSNMPRVQTPTLGASARFVVSPGHEDQALFHMPGGQSGNPLSPFYLAGHEAWVKGEPTPLLPGPAQHTLTLRP
jgi:penicillin G amidase